MSKLSSNTSSLQSILNTVNNLPNAGGSAELPTLSNPGSAEDLLLGKQLINQNGKAVTGTFTIDEELNTQDNLIAQITAALEGKTGGSGGGGNDRAIIEGTITEVNNPEVTRIRRHAFCECSNLTAASFPACVSIGYRAFSGCNKLTIISFPMCSVIDQYAFDNCSSLSYISFPMGERICGNAFLHCENLVSASLPACQVLGTGDGYDNGVFGQCTRLAALSLPACSFIGNMAFGACHNLSKLYLGSDQICTLNNANAFYGTPYSGVKASFSGNPYIYVPSSLMASYLSASNWSYYSKYFRAIEDNGKPITFTIDGAAFQAGENMTWTEWIGSDYNTGRFQLKESDGNGLSTIENDSYRVYEDAVAMTPVYSGSYIAQGHAYALVSLDDNAPV